MILMSETVNPKVHKFKTLLQDPDMYEAFLEAVVDVLTDPRGPQIVKRITNIERHLGANDDWCVWEDIHQEDREVLMPLTEQFDLISGRIDDVSLPVLKETVFTGNETDIRARLLLQKLLDFPLLNGLHQMSTKQVSSFLLNEVPEEHRTTEKSARKIAADVMRRAVELFPEQMQLNKNSKRELKVSFIEKR